MNAAPAPIGCAFAAQVSRRKGRYFAEVYDGLRMVWGKGSYATRAEAMDAATIEADLRRARAQGFEVRNAAQLIALRAAAPLRPATHGAFDVDGLALFDHARQPSLF